MNWTVPAGFSLFLAGAAAGLAQLWLRLWDPETFVKMMITIGVLLAIVLAWNLVVRERRDSEKIRDRSKLG
jgi:membrane protein implicated in regulation of membrane protease activity